MIIFIQLKVKSYQFTKDKTKINSKTTRIIIQIKTKKVEKFIQILIIT
jgi:hypothetical protein